MKKFSSFLVVLLLMLASFTAGVQYPRGDVDYDSQVDISDVVCLIDYLLSGTWPDEPIDEHEYIDLALPSGTLWATCNVGANAPEDYGDYFAWGETAPKAVYSLNTYKWYREGEYDAMYDFWHLSGMTKYCTEELNGYDHFTDGKTVLDPEDDAAYVNLGVSWRMPSMEELGELINSCTWRWTSRNDVFGMLGTGPNGNTIFFPATGQRWDSSLKAEGSWGGCWSRELTSRLYMSSTSYGAYFDRDKGVGFYDLERYGGFPVRAVRVSQK